MKRTSLKRWFLPGLKALLLIFIIVWFQSSSRTQELMEVIKGLPINIFLLAVLLGSLSMCIAAIRWRIIMESFGARGLPHNLKIIRLFFVGLFYNTFVPGAVGGDVVRGALTRDLFEKSSSSYIVVLLERLIGLSALGVYFLLGLFIGPALLGPKESLLAISLLFGLTLLILLVARLSGRLQKIWRSLPKVERPWGLIQAFLISLLSHAITLMIFFMLSKTLSIGLSLSDLIVIVPIALVAGFIPLAIVGLGPREASLVALLGLLGVESGQALALSLSFGGTVISIALVGGLLQLLWGRSTSDGDTNGSSAKAPPQG